MIEDTSFERMESRISSGFADVYASLREDSLPEVPQHLQEPSDDNHLHAPSSPPQTDWPPEAISYARPQFREAIDSRHSTPRNEHGNLRPSRRSSNDAFHSNAPAADLVSEDSFAGHALATGSFPVDDSLVVQPSFVPPWSQWGSQSRDGAASAETLQNSNNDEWFYVDQIASYLDMHQKAPIDVHTGFNYVDANEAARNLGLPDLNDSQMMLLMRAGLIVHHYASSSAPWRDALGAVQYEMQIEAGREADHEHSQRQFIKHRLMKQLAEAVSYCSTSSVVHFMRAWRHHLRQAREADYRLMAFDEQTLALPYFDGWRARKLVASNAMQEATVRGTREIVHSALKLYRDAFMRHKEADASSKCHYMNTSLMKTLITWRSRTRQVLENADSAIEDARVALQSKYFTAWRVLRLNIALSRRIKCTQLKTDLSRWRYALVACQRLSDLAVQSQRRRLFEQWRRELANARQLEPRCLEAGLIVHQNQLRSLLRHGWLESKTRQAIQECRKRRTTGFIRTWRAETRLSCYVRLRSRDALVVSVESWRIALHNAKISRGKCELLAAAEARELQQTIFLIMRGRLMEDISKLQPRLSLATEIVAGRHGLRLMQSCVQRSQALLASSESYLLRAALQRLFTESQRRRQARLDSLVADAVSIVEARSVINLFRAWRLQARTNALQLARLDLASQYGDCTFALQRWVQAADKIEDLELIAEARFRNTATSNAFAKWMKRMHDQIDAEVTAQTQVTLRLGLLAKRILRGWRRQHAHMNAKVAEWQEDSDRQLAVIYFRTLENRLEKRRYGTAALGQRSAVLSPQHTPSRRNAISPKALELWTARDPRKTVAPKTADEWGATPLSRRPGTAPRMLSTPTKPLRQMRDLKLQPKSEL